MASKGRGARNKGSSFERSICKKLTNLTGYKFNRTAYSGATHQDIVSANFVGDIYAENGNPYHMFNYELKNHDIVTLNNIVLCNGELPLFLKQVITDTQRLGFTTLPCLIIHIKRWKDLVVIPYNSDLYSEISETLGFVLKVPMKFTDERLGITYRYDFLVTTLEVFADIDDDILFAYVKCTMNNWNKYNKCLESEIKTDSIQDTLNSINKVMKNEKDTET